jgi:hypothetical protein
MRQVPHHYNLTNQLYLVDRQARIFPTYISILKIPLLKKTCHSHIDKNPLQAFSQPVGDYLTIDDRLRGMTRFFPEKMLTL